MARYHCLFASGLILLGACAAPAPPPAAPATSSNVQTYARGVLNSLAGPSFTEEIEFCGYIFEDDNGDLAHTIAAGSLDFCDYGSAPATTVASYHTHGNYEPNYDSEIPSVDDLEGSIDIGYDDYLGTPGGRFWINRADGVSELICGAGCLKSDPNYLPDPTLPVDNRYTLRDLEGLSS